MMLFPEAVRLALKNKGCSYEYNAGQGETGSVWYEKKFDKIMYVLKTTHIVGSMSVKQAKLYGTEEYLRKYGL